MHYKWGSHGAKTVVSPVDVPIELCRRNYDYLKELDFADTLVNQEPALLIGSDYYWKLVSGETIRSTKGPVAVHTELGWVVRPYCRQVLSISYSFYSCT